MTELEKLHWSRECPVTGCMTRLGGERHRKQHVALPHFRCSCDWVGTYINKHKSMMRRKEDTREHELLGPVV
jgi:hypothetical protein